jgi:hypothetical protein
MFLIQQLQVVLEAVALAGLVGNRVLLELLAVVVV